MNPDYGFSDDSSRIAYFDETTPFHWYIRSKIDSSITILLVEDDGEIQQYLFNTSGDAGKHILPVRPAFNMDTSNVLFTSAAQKEKVTGTGETLSSVSDYTGNEWKLTLLDGKRSSFTVDASEAETSAEVGYSNWSIPVAYSGAQTGDNEYVSALLCDNAGNVLYYGNLAQNSESGTATLNIPSGLAVGSYTLKVFSEQCNGDYKTDYASAFQEISLTVILPRETTPQATFSATGDNSGK